MSQAAVKKMIAVARERGYITYDELNDVMPPDQVASEQIEDVMSMLSEMGINIIEADEVEDDGPTDVTVVANDAKEVTLAATGKETLDRTDDPVRMYLREMGSVELLSVDCLLLFVFFQLSVSRDGQYSMLSDEYRHTKQKTYRSKI